MNREFSEPVIRSNDNNLNFHLYVRIEVANIDDFAIGKIAWNWITINERKSKNYWKKLLQKSKKF